MFQCQRDTNLLALVVTSTLGRVLLSLFEHDLQAIDDAYPLHILSLAFKGLEKIAVVFKSILNGS